MKIKDKIFKARSKLSIKTYKRPQLFVIVMMVLLNIFILIISAFLALVIDDSFNNFFDAFANGSLKWMLTPNAILLIENPNTLLLAVFVLVIGMVLFTGTIIALTTNAIKDYFNKKQSGSGRLILDNQIVVLNWNNKVPEFVADLIHLDFVDISLVILADVDKDEAEKMIKNSIRKTVQKKDLKNLNLLVKKGSPLIKSDLYDISIEKCRSILIMNSDQVSIDESLSKGDLNIIKVILNLGDIKFQNNPPIVAEIKNIETKDKVLMAAEVVKSLKGNNIIPVCYDRKLGHVIAQTIINPLIKDVYLTMFSFEGSEVYVMRNIDFDEALMEYSHVIPLAKTDDVIFVLAEQEKDISIKDSYRGEILTLKTKEFNFQTDMQVYIIGNNNKLGFIKQSFDEYEKLYDSHFTAHYINESELKDFVQKYNQSSEDSTILLLSDEGAAIESLDANIIDNLIYLQSNIKRDRNIIVEVLDPVNDRIIKDFNINNTIISNRIISLLLTKVAFYKETAAFYDNLLTIKSDSSNDDSQNIYILKANEMLDEVFPIKFTSQKQLLLSFYESFSKKYMLFGYFRNGNLACFSKDLNTNDDFYIYNDDLLVFIKI